MKTNSENRQSLSRMTGLAVLCAIVFLLTYLSTLIKFGPFSVTLSLVPFVIACCLYGYLGAAVIGTTFSLAIYLIDPTAVYLMSLSFFSSLLVIWVRSLLAGAGTVAVYHLFSGKKQSFAVLAAAAVCPILNTGFFLLGMFLCYRPILESWSGSSAVLKIILYMTGFNFLFEFFVNLILSSAVERIIRLIQSMHRMR